MVQACRYFTPPNKHHTNWHCHMGLKRSGDCHIFLGKARVCDFQWPQEEELERNHEEEWIVIDPINGKAERYSSRAAMMDWIEDSFDRESLRKVVILHVNVIKEYDAKPADTIKLVPIGG